MTILLVSLLVNRDSTTCGHAQGERNQNYEIEPLFKKYADLQMLRLGLLLSQNILKLYKMCFLGFRSGTVI